MSKPKAIKIADDLDGFVYSVPAHPLCTDAAIELRRLHAANAMLLEVLQNAIKRSKESGYPLFKDSSGLRAARAAIAKATGATS